jgi:ATP-dependent helicase HrpB
MYVSAPEYLRVNPSPFMYAHSIDHILPELREAIFNRPAVVLQAPPGSGKTTRVPLALLEAMSSSQGRIVMLEPRRIAAVAAARWMAHLLGEPVGKTVGYTIRFDRKISKDTRIEVVTEGILTRRLIDNPALDGVAMIIFDEFHERSLQADLGLALSLDIQQGLREDLKILVMSATIETTPLAALLGGAPVIAIHGESIPVAEHFLSDEGPPGGRDRPVEDRLISTVRRALRDTAGDILIFLPGAGEIRRAEERLREVVTGLGKPVSLHPLYGDLPFAEQERAIMPGAERKIVLATNIAETSLTIEGVQVVIDSGQVRRLLHDPGTGMNRLVTAVTSRASAIQRRGRAGRLGPGTCYRLYSHHVYDSMVPFDPPEITTADLSSLALDLATWGVTDPLALAWIDPPPQGSWEEARRLLMELDALEPNGTATPAGHAIARLPLHPRLGRMFLRAADLGYLSLGADLAALLSERDVIRGKPKQANPTKEADISKRLDLLQRWRKDKKAPAGTDSWALRSVERIAEQLRQLTGPDAGPSVTEDEGDVLSFLLLHAYPDRIAQRRTEVGGRYLLSQGRGVHLPQGSVLQTNPFLVAVRLDGGEKAEGTIHVAEAVAEETIRKEMGSHIKTVRRVEWDRQARRIVSFVTERLAALTLSAAPFAAPDGEVTPILCEVIRSGTAFLTFGEDVKQLRSRVALMKRTFPEEDWPDMTEEALVLSPETWLSPWLGGIRTGEQLARLSLLPALKALLSRQQSYRLDKDAPVAMVVPSGRTIALNYAAGALPILAVKLQELFGLALTPTVAGGRVAVLVHLLSPAGRPVQITRDLEGFWENGYPQVKKELQGRYPKHPWPDDPWNAIPTHKTSRKTK